jgi:hypothetical protein
MRPIVRSSWRLSRSLWTIHLVDVSIASVTGTSATPPVPKLDGASTAPRTVLPNAEPNAVNQARMDAVVDLIASLTGREVKLVPPTAYLVSAPTARNATEPVELLAPLGLAGQLKEEPGTLEVDITSVLRTGTAERMLLDQSTVGKLQLRSAVDVEL